jgi:anti-anti-sigma factor
MMSSCQSTPALTLTLQCPPEMTRPHLAEFEADAASRLNDALSPNSRGGVLELDLTSTSQIDSTGLSVVLSLIRRASQCGAKVRVRMGNSSIQRIFRFTRMDRLFDGAGDVAS